MYFMTNGNLFRAKSKGALVREFVECNPGQGDLLEMFVNDLRQFNLGTPVDYYKVLKYIREEWGVEAIDTFKEECDAVSVEYHPIPAKIYFYQHPTCEIKVTIDEDDVIDQIFMRGSRGLWKTLRADQAKARVFLNHAEEVARGESFGHYRRTQLTN